MIIASLCTIPDRRESFLQVIDSILHEQTHEVDLIHVWLNGYPEINPDLPQDERLHYHLEPTNPGPWVRYQSAYGFSADDVFVTLDDDLIYPKDYIEQGLAALARQTDKTSICFGGVFWDSLVPISYLDYHLHKRICPFTGVLSEDRDVPVLMGGVSFHRADNLKNIIGMELPGFATNDDLMASFHLQQRGVRIASAAKPQNWIREHEFQNAGHALWRRDRGTRVSTFQEMIKNLGFLPCPETAETQNKQPAALIIKNGEIPIKTLEYFRSDLPGFSLHTLEIVSGDVSSLTSRPLRNCFEHFVSISTPGGRFEYIPGVHQWRQKRREEQGWKQIEQYLNWLLSALSLQKVIFTTTKDTETWVFRKTETWAHRSLNYHITQFPEGSGIV